MEKPLVSYCLVTYNQEDYIKDALKSAFEQSYPSLEIIVSDDASTDNTWKIINDYVKNISTGHKFIINKNEKNLGLTGHINHIVQNIAKGEYILLAAGDDISHPMRVQTLYNILSENEDSSLITSDKITINHQTHYKDIVFDPVNNVSITQYTIDDYLKTPNNMIGGVGVMFKRDIYNSFGPLNPNCPTEDSTLRLRAILLGKIIEINSALLYYRLHSSNISNVSNIDKLSFQNLYPQYISDINTAYKLNIIDKGLNRRLLNKITYIEHINNIHKNIRNLRFKKLQIFYRITLKILNLKYRLFK